MSARTSIEEVGSRTWFVGMCPIRRRGREQEQICTATPLLSPTATVSHGRDHVAIDLWATVSGIRHPTYSSANALRCFADPFSASLFAGLNAGVGSHPSVSIPLSQGARTSTPLRCPPTRTHTRLFLRVERLLQLPFAQLCTSISALSSRPSIPRLRLALFTRSTRTIVYPRHLWFAALLISQLAFS